MNKIIIREWFSNTVYPLLFALCLIVSMGAYLTLDVLQQSVNDYIDTNQKQIVGGDIVLTHNQAFTDDLLTKINQLDPKDVVYDYQFNAIAYTKTGKKSLLTRIKAVSNAYPLYGSLDRKNSQQQWAKGSVLVEKQVLNGLDITIGDSIQIGEASFTVQDEIINEPDRPLTAFGFGARILLHVDDLAETQLLGAKSRINYRIEIKTDNPQEKDTLFDELSDLLADSKINLKTVEQSNTSISNLSQNFLVFLKLLVIAVIVLSGIGLMSVVSAFVSKQKNTNAIRTALGETSTSIVKSYRLLFLSMSIFSVALSWLLSSGVLYYGKGVFSVILPQDLALHVGFFSLIKALTIALGLTLVMTHFTLNSIHSIKPVAVLHKHQNIKVQSKRPWVWIIVALLGLFILLFSELNSLLQTVQVFIGMLLVWLVFVVLTSLLMRLIKFVLNRGLIKQWMMVLALQNIFRKNNQSTLFITALSLTTMILGSITLLDYSIQQQLIATYPEDAPNFFLLDIQTDQQQQLDKMLGETLNYYPVVRARIGSVNGIKSEILKKQLSRYDNISRMFNLSYADELLATETLYKSIDSNQLFSKTKNDNVPVSILYSFAEFLQVDLGDEVVFNVQGIKIRTTISSIRKRIKRGPSPFFYFIFPPKALVDAPQIRFATAKISHDKRMALQTQIAKQFPGITTLDGASIANKLKEFTDQLKSLVQIFTALSLFAGLLIFVASLVSTSQDRLKESFYYRMMGMQARDLLKLTLIEFLSLGLFAFNLGIAIASISAYLIITHWFSLTFLFPWSQFILANVLFGIILISLSLVYNNHVKNTKVVQFLQHEND